MTLAPMSLPISTAAWPTPPEARTLKGWALAIKCVRGIVPSAALIFLVPAVAAVMAWFLFNETLTSVQIMGMLVCAVGVFIVTRAGK